jgi:hypothetical protein
VFESTFRLKVFCATDEKPMIDELTHISWDYGQWPPTAKYADSPKTALEKVAHYCRDL